MKTFYELANADELRDELISYLKYFNKEENKYQTDLYLYVDTETNTGSLYEFVNVGGNSWLNDDHYTLYIDKPHYVTWEDAACDGFESEEDYFEYVDEDPDNYYPEKADEIIKEFDRELKYREEYEEWRRY